jgi:hypothetical protein
MATIRGGDKLTERLQEIAKGLSSAKTVQVGFLPDAVYDNGTFVATIAAIQEFGAPKAGIPPRPFFRAMINDHSGEWPGAVKDQLKETDYDAAKTLTHVGAGIAGQLQQSIADTSSPPLSQTTLMLRKMKADDPDLVVTGKTVGEAAAKVAAGESAAGVSTKPLVESGHLLASVDYVVK